MKALFQSICGCFCVCRAVSGEIAWRDWGKVRGRERGGGGSRLKFFYEYSIHIGIYSECNVNVCTCVYFCIQLFFVFLVVWGEGRGGACCCAVYDVRGLLTTTSFLQWPAMKPWKWRACIHRQTILIPWWNHPPSFTLGRNFLFFVFRDF